MNLPSADVGKRLRVLQAAGGLTQRRMAEQLGVHVNSLKHYQKGTTNPDAAFLAQVCRDFGVSADWLLMGKGRMVSENATPPQDMDAQVRINREASRLNESRLRMLEGLVRVLAKFEELDCQEELMSRRESGAPAEHALEMVLTSLLRIRQIEWQAIEIFARAEAQRLDDRLKRSDDDGGVRGRISKCDARVRNQFQRKVKSLRQTWAHQVKIVNGDPK